MKNLFFGLVLTCAFAFTFTSCADKCMTCTYDVAGTTITSDEVCGSKGDLDDAETAIEAAAALSGGVGVTCDRN